MTAALDLIIGTDLDALLAPLDDVAPGLPIGEPRDATVQAAYALGMLGADLTAHPPNRHLLEICRMAGVEEGAALTIGRAVASMLVRLAVQVAR